MFVYSQDDKSFYNYLTKYGGTFTKFSWSWYKVGMNRKTIPPGYFVLNSDTNFAHISTTRSLTDGKMNLGSGNNSVSWWCQIFHEILICIKNFFISKRQLFSLWVFKISQFATNLEHFLVYVLLVEFELGSFWSIKKALLFLKTRQKIL